MPIIWLNNATIFVEMASVVTTNADSPLTYYWQAWAGPEMASTA